MSRVSAWTPERRKAASIAAKERLAQARPLNDKELFAARNRARTVETDEVVSIEDGDKRLSGGAVQLRTAALVRVYKPGLWGYDPVNVPATNVDMVFKAGYEPYCPDCGTDTCDKNLSQCPGRPARMYRVCPIPSCRKRIWDTPEVAEVRNVSDDPNMIQDETYLSSTPELRTKARMDAHMYWKHPEESAALAPGNPRNPVLSASRERDMVT